MNEFETHCVKWEDHNSSININKKIIDQWPTVRIKIDHNQYQLGFTIHKWKLEPSGDALAILPIGNIMSDDDIFWKNPIESQFLEEIQNKSKSILYYIITNSLDETIKSIENSEIFLDDKIIYYKYHSNQWREIEKQKSKWIYKNKVIKTDICNVQRLLN